MASLASKVFAVTGGASGMGAATCRLLAKRGAAGICIGDWNETNFTSMKKELKDINSSTQVLTTKLDVSQAASVNSWIDEIISKFGRLDGAANVAGVAQAVGTRKTPTILEETDEAWRRTMGINLDGIFYCTRAEVKAMVTLPKQPRAIVNVSSMVSFMHGPDTYAYGASKSACAYFGSCVAKDVFPLGIRVNTVSPGPTDTPMMPQFFGGMDAAQGAAVTAAMGLSFLSADDIARQIVYLLSEDSEHIAGVNLAVGAGAP